MSKRVIPEIPDEMLSQALLLGRIGAMGNNILTLFVFPPVQVPLSLQYPLTALTKIYREAATHNSTPYFPWDSTRPAIFTPLPQITNIRGEYLQETDAPPLLLTVDRPGTATAPDNIMTTKTYRNTMAHLTQSPLPQPLLCRSTSTRQVWGGLINILVHTV